MLRLIQPRQVVRILHAYRLLENKQQTFSEGHAIRVGSFYFWRESPKLLRNVGDLAITFLIIDNIVSSTLGEGIPVEDGLLEIFRVLIETKKSFKVRGLTSSLVEGSYSDYWLAM